MQQEVEGYPEGYPDYSDESPIDLRRYAKALWRRKVFIIVPFFLFTAGSIFYALFYTKPIYQASATIVYQKQGLFTRPLESYLIEESGAGELDLVRTQIYSSQFLDKVVTVMGLDQNEKIRGEFGEAPEEVIRDNLVNYLRGLIRVNMESRGRVFRISAYGGSPDDAMNLANVVANTFVEENRRLQVQRIRNASDFTVEQLAAYKEKLQEAERRLQEYEKSIARRSISRDEASIAQRLDRAKSLLLTADVDLSEAENRLDRLEPAGIPWEEKVAKDNLMRDSRLSSLVSRFLKNESELVNLLLVKNWKDPAVISLNKDIYRTKERMRSRMKEILSKKYGKLRPEVRENIVERKLTEIEMKAIRNRKKQLQSYINRLEKEAGSGYETELILSRLREEVANSKKVYNLFLEQSAAAQISEALEITKLGNKFEILETAQRPLRPVKPNKKKIVLAGGFLGIFLGVALAFGLEIMDSSLKTVEEAERYLQLPVLGTVPVLPRYFRKEKRSKLKIAAVAISTLIFIAALSTVVMLKMGLWKKISTLLPL